FCVIMKDKMGLQGAPVFIENIIIDNTPPDVQLVGVVDGQVIADAIDLSAIASSDTREVRFEFVKEGSNWTDPGVVRFIDASPLDGFTKHLSPNELAEGTWTLRVVALDGTFSLDQIGTDEVHDLAILHLNQTIDAPSWGAKTIGYFPIVARTASANVTEVIVSYGFPTNLTSESVATWIRLGNDTIAGTSGTYLFQATPGLFGDIEAWLFLRADFLVGDLTNASAYTLVYVDTILPVFNLTFASGSIPDVDGYPS
nr:hypothetical protein [Candidatus Sigynarchaeota archaeon]